MADSDSTDSSLERDKLRLDIEKFLFEKEKFAADAVLRAEELAKLQAEKRKAELEVKDLEVPYRQRPAYRTAVFQGIALVIAVASGLLSLGAVKALYDANEAKREQNAAQERANAANKSATETAAKLQQYSDQLALLQPQLDAKSKQLSDTAYASAISPMEAILGNLGAADSALQAPDEMRLIGLMNAPDPDGDTRQKYLQAQAETPTVPLNRRLAALKALYKHAQAATPARAIDMARFKLRFIELATKQNYPVDTKGWDALRSYLGDEAAPLICGEYDKWNRSEAEISDDKFRLAEYITNQYIPLRVCEKPLWDFVDPRWDSAVNPKSRLDWDGWPPELLLARSLAHWKPFLNDDRVELIVSEKEGYEFFVFTGFTPQTGLGSSYVYHYVNKVARPKKRGELDERTLTSLSGPDRLAAIQKWAADNPKLVHILSEPGLPHLRLCDMDVLEMLWHEYYVGWQELIDNCPAEALQ